MSNQELPPNYDQLKQASNKTSNWKERLGAVEELGKWNHPGVVGVLTHRMNNDPVYRIREAAYRKLRAFGSDVQPPVRKPGDLIPNLTKTLVRIKKSLPKDHSYEDFKGKLRNMRIDIYDAYEGDKGEEFDKWLEDKWASLRTRKAE
jgi:hypothetical protein